MFQEQLEYKQKKYNKYYYDVSSYEEYFDD